MTREEFQNDIRAGIPDRLPAAKPYDKRINHAPKRKDILSDEEKALALKNALRYFPVRHHAVLAKEFAEELRRYGRIYMYRLRPDYEMHARPIGEYPARCRQAAAIMLMIQNNPERLFGKRGPGKQYVGDLQRLRGGPEPITFHVSHE